MDRFNLQIQIASTELKLQRLEAVKDDLERQIANELSQLAQLRMALGRGGQSVSPPIIPVRCECIQATPSEAHHELTEHLTSRGFTQAWVQHRVVGEQRQQIEYWTKSPVENAMLLLTSTTGELTDFKVFLDSQMCPQESLP